MGTKTRMLSQQELRAFIEVLQNPPEKLLIYAALAAVIIGTGARWGEAADMKISDLFEADGTPRKMVGRVLAKKRPKKSKNRLLMEFVTSNWEKICNQKISDLINPDGSIKDANWNYENMKAAMPKKHKEVAFPWKLLGAPIVAWRDAALKQFHFTPDHRLFSLRHSNSKLSNGNCFINNRRLLNLAGVDWRRVAFHGQRKTFLIMMYEEVRRMGKGDFAAADHAKDLAGHEDINVTIDYLKEAISPDQGEVAGAAFARAMK